MLSAAIRSNAQVLVTWNLSDFPAAVLEEFDIEVPPPDRFVRHLIDLAPARVAQVLIEQASSLEAPPLSLEELLRLLRRDGLATAMAALEEYRGETTGDPRNSLGLGHRIRRFSFLTTERGYPPLRFRTSSRRWRCSPGSDTGRCPYPQSVEGPDRVFRHFWSRAA